MSAATAFQCACIWLDQRCPNNATQEDGLCDWCGVRRVEQLRDNLKAMFDPITGEYLGLGGAGELHTNTAHTPDACWLPNSGRDFARPGRAVDRYPGKKCRE